MTSERWRESSEYRRGFELYNSGLHWHAHEVWESVWLAAGQAGDEPQRQFIQGLIQCAAACVKASQGKRHPARRLAARGLARLRAYDGVYMGIDVPAFVQAFAAWVAGDDGDPPPLRLLD